MGFFSPLSEMGCLFFYPYKSHRDQCNGTFWYVAGCVREKVIWMSSLAEALTWDISHKLFNHFVPTYHHHMYTWLMPLGSLWNKGLQQHPSSELDSGWSSLARPMLFRRLLSRHWCFSTKSALGFQPYASLADSSQGLAWWCWMQAFVAYVSLACIILYPLKWPWFGLRVTRSADSRT